MTPRRDRRGAYAPLFALVLVGVLSIGALSMDTAQLGQCRAEARAVADAAARGGLVVLRRTGDTGTADGAISALAAASEVCGGAPDAPSVTWGRWDDTAGSPSFVAAASPPNAVRVTIERSGANAVPTLLAGLMGFVDTQVGAEATAAARSVQTVFVVDQQSGWTEANFLLAQDALQAAVTKLADSAGPADAVAVIGTSGPFAWQLTPMTTVGDASGRATVEADLAALGLASFAGDNTSLSDGVDCTVDPTDDFSDPSGGCQPDMPRRYADEDGADLAVGLDLAWAELTAAQGVMPVSYRTVLVLTAHAPTGVPAAAGTERTTQSYVESRFVELVDTIPIDAATIRTDATTRADALWDDLRAHTWVVAFDVSDALFTDILRGDGWLYETADAGDLDSLTQALVSAWPIAVVE